MRRPLPHPRFAAVLLLAVAWPALAYDPASITLFNQFHIANDPATFDGGLTGDGLFAYVQNQIAGSQPSAQYTQGRLVLRPQSGNLSRIEPVQVTVVIAHDDIGGGNGCSTIRRLGAPTAQLEICAQTMHVQASLLTNVTYQIETNAVARNFPGSHYSELRFAIPAEVRSSISGGEGQSCRVRADGALRCWGDNTFGQSTAPSGSFLSVSAGKEFTCGLRDTGAVACWGQNGDGQRNAPVGTFSSVDAGGYHACAVRTDGTLACWGNNAFGQSTAPTGTYLAVSAGYIHTCAIRTDGTLACWGYNNIGQSTPPTGTFTAVSAGNEHTCGIRSDGTLACWGWNGWGQADPPAGSYTAVDASYDNSCATGSGGIRCWGKPYPDPTPPPTGAFQRITAGYHHGCGVRADDTVACWGYNWYGQAPRLRLVPTSLATATVGQDYFVQLALEDASTATNSPAFRYTPPTPGFARVDGSLPAGVTFSSDGRFFGRPTMAGQYDNVIEGEDDNGLTASAAYSIEVAGPVDDTPPSITPDVTGISGDNGWYTSNVGVSWTLVDAESGITSTTGCAPATIDGDTAGATFTCTATSDGGTATGSITIKRDATPPVLVPVVSPNPVLLGGNASASSGAGDAMSGVASQACAPVSTSTVGARTTSCTAVDRAGNAASQSAAYTVVYGFQGFFAPVDNLPAANLAKAGRTVPFKWRLASFSGAPVTTLSNVVARTSVMACDGATVTDAIEEYAASNTGLVNNGDGSYQYNWQSSKAMENTCRKVIIELDDGTRHEASFRFQ
jgi:hypothetical protein